MDETAQIHKQAAFNIHAVRQPNFGRAYCPSQAENSDTVVMSENTAQRSIDYLKYMRDLLPAYQTMHVRFTCGEPMPAVDRLGQIIRATSDFVSSFRISTASPDAASYADEIESLVLDAAKSELSFAVCYGWTLQDDDGVRDSIRWLYSRGLLDKVITVFTYSTLSRINEVFTDFLALRKECPKLTMSYNLALGDDASNFNEAATVAALEKVKAHLEAFPGLRGSFIHNASAGSGRRYERNPRCLCGNIVACIDADGSLYPISSVPFYTAEPRNRLCYGNVSEDFGELNARQMQIQNGLDLHLPEKCLNCEVTCRVPFFAGNLTDANLPQPSEESCQARNLLHSYLGEYRS